MLAHSLLAVSVLLGLLAPAHARRDRPRQPPMEKFAADGTVQAVWPGRIQMLTTSNQSWMIFIDPKAVIHVTGTAQADFLRPGMFIQFTAEFDNRGKAQGKLGQLTIFTPSEKDPLGIWPEGAGPAAGEPGEAEDGFGGGINGGKAGGMAPASSIYSVAGRITSLRRGKLKVHAGRGVVQIELAENPSIKVDFANYSVARKGDKISVVKGKMPAGTMGFTQRLAQASELKIELAQPLSSGKKKPVRPKKPTRPKRPPSQPKREDPKPEPLEVEPEGDL